MNKRGFSIVEVMISLALLLFLAGMANTAVNAAAAQRDRARQISQNAETARLQLYTNPTGTTPLPDASYTYNGITITARVSTLTVGSNTYLLFDPPEDEP